jgi:UDP-N-acetylglucosamine--N-acetylmuramyl-(pentapeptide) pyrophosphoryl-undecaprenol N-acetylglucosamine transferase
MDARKQYKLSPDEKVLLVLGGGSGSQVINDAIRAQIKDLTEFCTVLHVCGKGNRVESNVKNYIQEEFIEDVGKAYACADLVLSRAGAGAIFETIALKKPAIFVPLAHSSRGDQLQNAEYFHKKGLCRVLAQENLNRLSKTVKLAFADKELFIRLQEHTQTNGTENALAEIRRLLRP